MDSEEDVIDLLLCSNKILIWKAEDVKTIREKHNIVGKLIGCLPRAPHQNLQLGLPLQLMPEEAAVLIEYGVARIINIKVKIPTAADVHKYQEDRLKSFSEQKQIMQSEKESKKVEFLNKNKADHAKKKKTIRKERARSRKMMLSGKTKEEVARKIESNEVVEELFSNKPTEEEVKDSIYDCLSNTCSITTQVVEQKEKNIDKHPTIDHDLEEITKYGKRERDNTDSEEHVKRQKIIDENKDEDKTELTKEFEERSQVDISKHGHLKLTEDKTSNKNEDVDTPCNINYSTKEAEPKNKCELFKVDEKEETSISKANQGCLIHLPTSATNYSKHPVDEWNYPSTETDWLRFRVFKDFWEKGYFLTSGGKFGGDFLVYPGNPLLFHSSYIAICRPHCELFSARDLVQFGRMASNVRKTVIICSLDKQDTLVYTSVQWTGVS
ncbi:tRNA-splicing endonuclease subunit Sen34-like [Antedon mediterranea]|uniref:tRNA-splicing endonuclease subunit Sen34-like n=1 Tax=Antedon mediterranea TaxID=105859 RepID=UPI003AF7AEFA